MKYRALSLAATFSLAMVTSASSSSIDYRFDFADNDVSGMLSFGSNSVGTRQPGYVFVADSDGLGSEAEGEYDTSTATGSGFTFDGVGDIVGSDYAVSRLDSSGVEELRFVLNFDSTQPDNYVLGCAAILSADDCVNNAFANGRVRQSLSVTYTRIEDNGQDLTSVPLPAGLPLLLAGLAVFAGVRARKSQA